MKKSEFLKFLSIPLRKASQDLGGAPAVAESPMEAAPEVAPKVTVEKQPLTVRGKPVRIRTKDGKPQRSPEIDIKKGVLHTSRGSFPLYLPHTDKRDPDAGQKFDNILNDTSSSSSHDRAMGNWLHLNKALKEGKLPPKVVMHAALFSMMSPQTEVPVQEYMYSHLVDAMKDTGIDATDPRFADPKGAVFRNWLERDQPQNMPQHSRGHFLPGTPTGSQLRVSPDSVGGKRNPGELYPFDKPDSKIKDMLSFYPGMHEYLSGLFKKHGADASSLVREMMDYKHQKTLHNNARRLGLKAGKEDVGPWEGTLIKGLAPKTARYMAAMAGGGNVHVPDTHFIRHMFGLEQGKDSATSDYLKSVLWDEKNSHLLDQIDDFYFKHHPAVKWMLTHPQYGQHFQGQDARHAIFPAFWKHWAAIVPHERSRGMRTGGANEGTDHAPFFEATLPLLGKSESMGNALKLARTHADWVKKYGEMPALHMYFQYIVPQLMGNKEKPVMKKSESMRLINAPLRKAALPAAAEAEAAVEAQPEASEHPALVEKDGMPVARFGVVTADAPKYPSVGKNPELEAELKARGHNYEPVVGRYDNPEVPEHGFLIHGISPEEIADLGHRYGQESVIHTDGGRNKLIYTNGPEAGKFVAGRGWDHAPSDVAPKQLYSTVLHNGKPRHFSLGLNFDNGTFDNDEAAFSGPKLVEKSMKKSESLRLIHAPIRKDEAAVGHKGVGIGRIKVIHPDGTKKDPGPSAIRANAGKMKVRHNDGGVSERSMRAGQVRDEEGNPVSPKSRNRAKERA